VFLARYLFHDGQKELFVGLRAMDVLRQERVADNEIGSCRFVDDFSSSLIPNLGKAANEVLVLLC